MISYYHFPPERNFARSSLIETKKFYESSNFDYVCIIPYQTYIFVIHMKLESIQLKNAFGQTLS